MPKSDPPNASKWSTLGAETINSTAHRALVSDAGLQSLVLLTNQGDALPLSGGSSVAVVGPQAVGRHTLLSDYYGDEVCWTSDECQGHDCFDCIPTVAEAVERANLGGVTTSAAGVEINSNDTSGIAAALDLARAADAVVLVLGIDHSIEREGTDRTDTALPGEQEPFAKQVLALGKPTVLVLVNGGALAIDGLLDEAREAPYAIVEAFNPNVGGGAAIAASLFGHENKWGKLPVTMYPHGYIADQPMTNYDMSKAPGRTYRYYTGTPLFEFGTGLSLTSFELSCARDERSASALAAGTVVCELANVGDREGDEVVMAYHSAGDEIRAAADHPVPRKSLFDFERVTLASGGKTQLRFPITDDALKLVNGTGDRVLVPGNRTLIFSTGAGPENIVPWSV